MHPGITHLSNELEESNVLIDHDEISESDPEFKNITKFMGAFFVHLDRVPVRSSTRARRLKDSIFVFKKKRLPLKVFETKTDIYASGLRGLELDMSNHNKSRSSCLRCRRNRRKCTRDLPECLNCTISEELCVYEPRKKRRHTHPELDCPNVPRASVEETPSMYSIHGQEIQPHSTETTACPRGSEIHSTISTEADKLRGSTLQNIRAKHSSDLMRLLN